MSESVNKKSLSERDICTKYITSAIEAAGWDKMMHMREEVSFTDGRSRFIVSLVAHLEVARDL